MVFFNVARPPPFPFSHQTPGLLLNKVFLLSLLIALSPCGCGCGPCRFPGPCKARVHRHRGGSAMSYNRSSRAAHMFLVTSSMMVSASSNFTILLLAQSRLRACNSGLCTITPDGTQIRHSHTQQICFPCSPTSSGPSRNLPTSNPDLCNR